MELLCIDQFSTLGGAQQCFLDLIPTFRSRNWRVRVVLPGRGVFGERLAELDCDVDFFRPVTLSSRHKPLWEFPKYLITHLRVSQALARSIRARRPDLIYVNGPRFLPAASWIARQHEIPLLYHAHNRVMQATALVALRETLALSKGFLVSCCAFVAHQFEQYVPAERIRVVYNGVPDLQSRNYSCRRHIRTIGVVGRLAPEKGQLEFIRAARLVHETVPSTDFIVIGAPSGASGTAYYRKVQRESRDLPVLFAGWNEEPSIFMQAVDLLVVSSAVYDAAPRVILEAFSAGVPVVAFPSGGIPELITNNRTGFLTKERSVVSLASRILDVLRMPDGEVDRITTNARYAWRERFHVNRYRESLCDAICLAAKTSPTGAVV